MKDSSKRLGIWIDRQQAILVTLDGATESVERVESHVERYVVPPGSVRPSGTGDTRTGTREHAQDERLVHQLHSFYQGIAAKAAGAGAIYVCGPGEARQELAKELRKTPALGEKVVAVAPCDNVSEKQLVAKLKEFFAVPAKRQLPAVAPHDVRRKAEPARGGQGQEP